MVELIEIFHPEKMDKPEFKCVMAPTTYLCISGLPISTIKIGERVFGLKEQEPVKAEGAAVKVSDVVIHHNRRGTDMCINGEDCPGEARSITVKDNVIWSSPVEQERYHPQRSSWGFIMEIGDEDLYRGRTDSTQTRFYPASYRDVTKCHCPETSSGCHCRGSA